MSQFKKKKSKHDSWRKKNIYNQKDGAKYIEEKIEMKTSSVRLFSAIFFSFAAVVVLVFQIQLYYLSQAVKN